MLRLVLLVSVILCFGSSKAGGIDHQEWDSLLKKHVRVLDNGKATQVDYSGFLKDREQLTAYLDQLAGVTPDTFERFTKDDQLAFLINAYNSWTVELILSKYPKLDSIKDLGSFFQSPWKKRFINLLGEKRTLDDIEHTLIRGSGKYDEPRIHFAVNCASIGCPALKNEAYSGKTIDLQLEESTELFLQDRTRNRMERTNLKISSLFKWYKGDFEKGWRGASTLQGFLLLYADALNLESEQKKMLAKNKASVDYLDYEWNLNDTQ